MMWFRFGSPQLALLTLLIVSHGVIGGFYTSRTVVWLLTRNVSLHSDEMTWARENVDVYSEWQEIDQKVPLNARLLVYSDSEQLALQVAFYCFPRPVQFRLNAAASEMRLDRIDDRIWELHLPNSETR